MNNKKIIKRIFLGLWIAFFAGVIALVTLFVLIAKGHIGYMPSIEELENPKSKFATIIYSHDGEEMGRYTQAKENRIYVSYKDLNPDLVYALIATEDERYQQHSGIDFEALARVLFKTVILQQSNAGGGSTISQQLAKLLYSPTADNLFQRALQKPIEWVIAVELERLYTKEEIVNMYFNKFDFNYNAIGIRSAAQVYFGKLPKDLKIEESAMLVGMLKNPSLYNPLRRPEMTQERRNVVLNQMQRAGYLQHHRNSEGKQESLDVDSLKAIPLTLSYHSADHKEGLAPYFREYLRRIMQAKKPVRSNYASWQGQKYLEDVESWETNPLFGWCNKNLNADGKPYNLGADGLRIYTSIDSRMQRYAEEAMVDHLKNNLQPAFYREKKHRSNAPFSSDLTPSEVQRSLERTMRQSERYIMMKKSGKTHDQIVKSFHTPREMKIFTWDKGMVDTLMTPMDSVRHQKYFLRAGMMSIDPRTGLVKAYVGGPNFENFQYDMATQGRRQVGSTIKPFLYTLAMEEGSTPCDEILNVQPSLVDENGKTWTPRNASTKRIGEVVTLRWGLATSNNWISAQIMDRYSPHAFVRLLRSFGIKAPIDPVISIALGPSEFSVEEMVTGYTAFPNKGIRTSPVYVTRIADNNGNIIAEFTPEVEEVFSESTYFKMLPMLQDVINEGTGSRIRRIYNIEAPMGGKTGTTNDNSDGWFMGFTPSLVTGVWVGGEERAIRFDNMALGQGANMALPIYGEYMKKVYTDESLKDQYNEEQMFNNENEIDPCQKEESIEEYEVDLDEQEQIIDQGIFD